MDERVEHYDNSHILPLLEIYTMFMRYFQTISFQEYYSAQGMKKKPSQIITLYINVLMLTLQGQDIIYQ